MDAAPIIPPPPFISSNIESSQPQATSLVRCEKDPNCDMETPPRKMISQYFGRNKSCTKAIPRHVWLHFCRRHYQRERYQRGPDFPKEQIKWLLEQIRRIQSWSDENVARGQASGVLQGWKLQLRKREVDRQSRNNADSDDEDGVTPVPQWLLGKADHNYGTEEILAMMGRLRDEILADKLKGMPEIEILPDITAHHKAPPKKRTARVSKAHRRVKSQGAPRTSVGGSSGVLPGLPSIPAVAASAGPAAPLGTSNTAPIVPVGTFTTATPNTLPELNSSRRSSLGSSHAFSAGGSPPRAEKRKAEESLEASATPPSIRRPALPHRPSLKQVREECPPSAKYEPSPERPSWAHNRSWSDVPNIPGGDSHTREAGYWKDPRGIYGNSVWNLDEPPRDRTVSNPGPRLHEPVGLCRHGRPGSRFDTSRLPTASEQRLPSIRYLTGELGTGPPQHGEAGTSEDSWLERTKRMQGQQRDGISQGYRQGGNAGGDDDRLGAEREETPRRHCELRGPQL